jgi:hypothetical protein
MKNSSDTIRNGTHDHPVCSTVPQPTASRRAPPFPLSHSKILSERLFSYTSRPSSKLAVKIVRSNSTLESLHHFPSDSSPSNVTKIGSVVLEYFLRRQTEGPSGFNSRYAAMQTRLKPKSREKKYTNSC